MNVMIIVILIFCNIIMAFTTGIAAKPHNYVIVENTFPADKINDPRVIHFAKSFRKRLYQLAAVLTAADLLLFLPMKDSSFMLLFFLLLYLTIGGNYMIMIRYIRKGHQLIVENDWQLTTQPVQVDTQLVVKKNLKMVSPLWFLASLAVFLLLTVFIFKQDEGNLSWILLIANLLVWASMIFFWWIINRLPARSITDDREINQHYNDLTKFYWSFLTVFMSFLISLIVYLPLLTMEASPNFFTIITFVEFLLIFFFVGFTIWWLFQLRKKQDQLLTQTSSFRYSGDDYYWRYGIYFNPNDSRWMVPDRIGMNISFNLGKVGGKLIMALVPIILIGATVISVYPLYVLDYHPDPLSYEVKQDAVILDGPFTKKQQIAFDKINEVELVKHLPFGGVRTNGFATKNYATGYFRLDGKPAILFIDHESRPILKISTSKKTFYYTNKKPAETKKLYHELQTVQ